MNEAVQEQIKNDVTNNKIYLYMKGTPEAPMCGFSSQAVNLLQHYKVEFKSTNVLEDDAIRQGIKEYSDWPTIPQLYVNGEFVGGCDIISEMHTNGELENVLKA